MRSENRVHRIGRQRAGRRMHSQVGRKMPLHLRHTIYPFAGNFLRNYIYSERNLT